MTIMYTKYKYIQCDVPFLSSVRFIYDFGSLVIKMTMWCITVVWHKGVLRRIAYFIGILVTANLFFRLHGCWNNLLMPGLSCSTLTYGLSQKKTYHTILSRAVYDMVFFCSCWLMLHVPALLCCTNIPLCYINVISFIIFDEYYVTGI